MTMTPEERFAAAVALSMVTGGLNDLDRLRPHAISAIREAEDAAIEWTVRNYVSPEYDGGDEVNRQCLAEFVHRRWAERGTL
jgi:hypothetical protein